MKQQILICFSFIYILTSPCLSQTTDVRQQSMFENVSKQLFCYTNPITRDSSLSMRDYCIIKVKDKWYCTGTSHPVWEGPNPGVRLLVSDDLIHWRHHSWIIDAKKLPSDYPYNGRFWAPEIHYIRNKYWLTVNSGRVTEEDPTGMKTHSIWLFVSDSITGPYNLVNGPLTSQYNNDATLFEDEDGRTYLYCSGNGLFQAEINLEKGILITPIQKILDKRSPGNPDWVIGGIEAPWVIKKDGVYFMFFSSWTRGYEVGLLKSESPLGPWEFASREPIFGSRKKRYRPELAKQGGYDHLQYSDSKDPYCEAGHIAIFEGPDGKFWISCHYTLCEGYNNSESDSWKKLLPQMGIEPLYYKDGMFYINGPTWTTQCIEY